MKGYIKISSESHEGPLQIECKCHMNGFGDPCNIVDAVLEAVCRDPEDKQKILSAVTANMIMESITGERNSQKIVCPLPDEEAPNDGPRVGLDKNFFDFLNRRGRDDG